MKLLFKKLDDGAKLPTRGSEHAAGYDLHSAEDLLLPPYSQVVVSTGLSVAIPEGHYGRIAPRSGLAVQYRINIQGGVIDQDYRGEVKVLMMNHGPAIVEIDKGQRIAQLILERISTPEAEWAEELPETTRGIAGFGSSGR